MCVSAGQEVHKMTIIELRDRLTEIIEENNRRGWGERNNSKTAVRIDLTKRTHELRTIRAASSGWLGIGSRASRADDNVFELILDNSPVWTNSRKGSRSES
jgi:hypothetical protein